MQERLNETIREIEDRKFKTKEDYELMERCRVQVSDLIEWNGNLDKQFHLKTSNDSHIKKFEANNRLVDYCQDLCDSLLNQNYKKSRTVHLKTEELDGLSKEKNYDIVSLLEKYNKQYLTQIKKTRNIKNIKSLASEIETRGENIIDYFSGFKEGKTSIVKARILQVDSMISKLKVLKEFELEKQEQLNWMRNRLARDIRVKRKTLNDLASVDA